VILDYVVHVPGWYRIEMDSRLRGNDATVDRVLYLRKMKNFGTSINTLPATQTHHLNPSLKLAVIPAQAGIHKPLQ